MALSIDQLKLNDIKYETLGEDNQWHYVGLLTNMVTQTVNGKHVKIPKFEKTYNPLTLKTKEIWREYKEMFGNDQMNDLNKKAMDIFTKDGLSSAVDHMFTDEKTGKTLCYGDFRARYG